MTIDVEKIKSMATRLRALNLTTCSEAADAIGTLLSALESSTTPRAHAPTDGEIAAAAVKNCTGRTAEDGWIFAHVRDLRAFVSALELPAARVSDESVMSDEPFASEDEVERAKFESWWVRDVPARYRPDTLRYLRRYRDSNGKYDSDRMQFAWEAWQARAATQSEPVAWQYRPIINGKPYPWIECTKEAAQRLREEAFRETHEVRELFTAPSASKNKEVTKQPVAQWQVRLKDGSPPAGDKWANISESGARQLMEKWAEVYEVRALFSDPSYNVLTEQDITEAVKEWFPDRAYQAEFFARALLNGESRE